jgi:hypothetical protein
MSRNVGYYFVGKAFGVDRRIYPHAHFVTRIALAVSNVRR